MTKYVLVNETERVRFEKEYFMPLGYCNQHCFVSDNLINVITQWKLKPDNVKMDYMIEKHTGGNIECIFPCEGTDTIQ